MPVGLDESRRARGAASLGAGVSYRVAITKRSQSRILALQALCVWERLGDEFAVGLERFLRDTVNHADLGWHERVEDEVIRFAKTLARGAWERRATYDALLKQHVADWSVERMQPVDRNILRLGLFELLEQPRTPHAVVLNEAVELAQIFGGAESSAFVNGVLDSLRKKLDLSAGVDAAPTAPQHG